MGWVVGQAEWEWLWTSRGEGSVIYFKHWITELLVNANLNMPHVQIQLVSSAFDSLKVSIRESETSTHVRTVGYSRL